MTFSSPDANPHHQPRLGSLDRFRGLTLAAMVLVNNPGNYSATYPPLLHAEWSGATFTDMIFPSFLVMTGVAMTLSFAARLRRGQQGRHLPLHILRRSALIFFLGLLLNGFPDYHLQTLRIPGVLQRIALCYLFGSLLYLAVHRLFAQDTDRDRRRRGAMLAGLIVFLLAVYWILLKTVPVPGFGPGHLDSNGNLGAYLDRRIFGLHHLWALGITPGVGVTFDPEGLLSTVPSLATMLMGVLAGEWVRGEKPTARKASWLAFAGFCLVTLGLALSPVMPLIKKIWTPTFAMVSGGFAVLAFALVLYLVDVRGWRRLTGWALVFGTNSILAYALSDVLEVFVDRLHVAGPGRSGTLHAWTYRELFATWLSPFHASLAYALLLVFVCFLLLQQLYRRKVFFRF